MNPEIKKQWVAALRSGEYKQGKAVLRVADQYCCLGVLCDLAVKAGVTTWEPGSVYGVWKVDNDVTYLPVRVMAWAGIDEDPCVKDEEGYLSALTEWNDIYDYSFAKIADAIEEQL